MVDKIWKFRNVERGIPYYISEFPYNISEFPNRINHPLVHKTIGLVNSCFIGKDQQLVDWGTTVT
jgi:hypothetical protein